MGTTGRLLARELIDLVLDAGSYESWDEPADISGHSEAYQAELRAAVALVSRLVASAPRTSTSGLVW